MSKQTFHEWFEEVQTICTQIVPAGPIVADWQGMYNCNYTPHAAVYSATGVDVAWMGAMDFTPPYSLAVYRLEAFGQEIGE